MRGPLQRVSAAGGEPSPLTEVKPFQNFGHRWPFFLPDGEHFLYWAQTHATESIETSGIFISSLTAPREARMLVTATESGMFANGYLLYVNKGTLMGAPFDAAAQKVTAAAVPVAENVETPAGWSGMTIFPLQRTEPWSISLAAAPSRRNSPGSISMGKSSTRYGMPATTLLSNCRPAEN